MIVTITSGYDSILWTNGHVVSYEHLELAERQGVKSLIPSRLIGS